MNYSLKEIKRKLKQESCMPFQASSIAQTLFLENEQNNNEDTVKLISLFLNKLIEWDLERLWFKQLNYGKAIADSEFDLEYEEMHKLYSLCDEIYCLEKIGLKTNENIKKEFFESIQNRLQKESKKAKLVAEDKIEDWNKDLWWYKI